MMHALTSNYLVDELWVWYVAVGVAWDCRCRTVDPCKQASWQSCMAKLKEQLEDHKCRHPINGIIIAALMHAWASKGHREKPACRHSAHMSIDKTRKQ